MCWLTATPGAAAAAATAAAAAAVGGGGGGDEGGAGFIVMDCRVSGRGESVIAAVRPALPAREPWMDPTGTTCSWWGGAVSWAPLQQQQMNGMLWVHYGNGYTKSSRLAIHVVLTQ